MKAFRILFLLTLCATTLGSLAQQCLVLEKYGSPKRIKYQAGDQLKYTVATGDTLYEDQITAVFDTAVAFGNKLVLINSIDKVWIGKERFWLSRLKIISILGGVGFFTIDTFNRLVNGDQPLVTKAGKIALSTALVVPAILTITKKRWFRVNKNHHLKYLDLTIG